MSVQVDLILCRVGERGSYFVAEQNKGVFERVAWEPSGGELGWKWTGEGANPDFRGGK